MALLHKAQTAVRLFLKLPPPLIDATLLGRTLHVHEGAVGVLDGDHAWLLALALRAEHILDVGSNVGQAALIMLQSPSVRQIDLVDPNPAALSLAIKHLILNGYADKARLVCAFADLADDQEMTLWTTGTGTAGSMFHENATTAAKRGESLRVPTVTLDTLADRFGMPDLVKVDVEGAESRTLAGARRIAEGGKTRFMVEMHTLPGHTMAQHCALIDTWARSVGHRTWFMRDHVPLSEAEIVAKRTYLLVQPESWPYPDWLRALPYKATLESVAFPGR